MHPTLTTLMRDAERAWAKARRHEEYDRLMLANFMLSDVPEFVPFAAVVRTCDFRETILDRIVADVGTKD